MKKPKLELDLSKCTKTPWKAEISPNQFAHSDDPKRTGFVALICGNYDDEGKYGDSIASITTSFYPSPEARQMPEEEWRANIAIMVRAGNLFPLILAKIAELKKDHGPIPENGFNDRDEEQDWYIVQTEIETLEWVLSHK